MQLMTPGQVRRFLLGRQVHAFDPQTGTRVAMVEYQRDGTCTLHFATGETESGVYGFDGNSYWTRYDAFRGGKTNSFHLQARGPGVAQAHFTDGRRAYLQSHHPALPGA